MINILYYLIKKYPLGPNQEIYFEEDGRLNIGNTFLIEQHYAYSETGHFALFEYVEDNDTGYRGEGKNYGTKYTFRHILGMLWGFGK